MTLTEIDYDRVLDEAEVARRMAERERRIEEATRLLPGVLRKIEKARVNLAKARANLVRGSRSVIVSCPYCAEELHGKLCFLGFRGRVQTSKHGGDYIVVWL